MARQRIILGLFLASLGVVLWHAITHPNWWSIPAALFGWFLADAASGLIHMYMDYRPCPPGKRLDDIFFFDGCRESEDYLAMQRARMASINAFERIVYDFKNHHPRPDALGRRPLWRLIGSTVILAALPLTLALDAAITMTPVPGWVAAGAFAGILGGAFAQYFHGSLHRTRNPWFVDAARRVGLLMTPTAHQRHHDTLQRDFATNCGWSNPLLNPLFRMLRRRGYLEDSGLVPGP
jgi:hypothetical protein